jgi:serine/threonine protein kinase/WD40 repeat protein
LSGSDESRDPLDKLGDEFLARFRRGERPAVSEFAARDPEHAGEIRELLSALLLVEGLKPQADATVAAGCARGAGRDAVPERVGDFRVLRELGRGGMGVVYEAEQESLGRRVALKVLAPGVARSPEQVRRFVREARSAARLHHTNIVPVFGVGEHDGLHYYAMQFIPGLGLDKVLDEVRRLKDRDPSGGDGGASSTRPSVPEASSTLIARSVASGRFGEPSPPAEGAAGDAPARPSTLAAETDSDARYARGVARTGLQVAEALEYAHQQGTLHRDVKPSNILLDVHGVAWVTDFGLAKAAEDEDLTRTGDLVGTIRYMAPERFRGQGDARSDVYGLGLALYELLALRPAFRASDPDRLLYEVNHVEPPPLRSVNPSVPRDLATIVHRAIEMQAAHRYATAAALAEDLRRFLDDRPIVARRVRPAERLARWARRNPGQAALGVALALMLALVVVVFVAADLRLRREHADTVFYLGQAERAEARARSKLLDSYITQARASRRGRHVGRRSEGLRAIGEAAGLDTTGARRLELRNEAVACLALPDLRPLDPWPGRAEDGFIGVDFDPTSGRIARGTPDGAVLIRDPAGGEPARLPGDGRRALLLRFSPDGRRLAVKSDGDGRPVLAVWDVGRREKILEEPDGIDGDAVDFHPDGRTLAAGRRDGSIVLYDLDRRRQLRRLRPSVVAHLIRFDPSGGRIAVVNPDSREGVQVLRADDGSVVAAWATAEPAYTAAWHPDGRWLAVGTEEGRIRLLDPHDPGRAPRTFGGHDGQVVALAVHPGGTLVASASWDATVRLWDARTGQELVKGPVTKVHPIRFSRDGRLLGPGSAVDAAWLWEVTEGSECRALVGPDGEGARTATVEFLDAGGVLVSSGDSGLRFGLPAGGGTTVFAAMPGTRGLAVAPDGSYLITGGQAGLLRWPVRRSSAGQLRIGPPAPLGPMAGVPTGRVRLARDGRTLAAIVDNERGRVRVFDLEGRRPPIDLTGHDGMNWLALSPDGRRAATGTWQGDGVKVWDARTAAEPRALPVEGSADVRFSPDGRLLLTMAGAEYVLWEVGTWSDRVRIPRSQAGGMPGVAAFSPDGRLLAVTHTRSTVQLVDPATGRELTTLEAPDPQNVTGLGFSPDGRLLIAALYAPRIQVWDLGAIRCGLAAMDLDWSSPSAGGPEPPARDGPSAIAIEPAPWLEPLERGESSARAGRWDEAASAFDEAIAAGAPDVEARARRLLVRRARTGAAAYREACRELLRDFAAADLPPRIANLLAWSCALDDGVVEDYAPLVRLAESAVVGRPSQDRLNTLGALLYRAGRFEEAVRQLQRSVEMHGAGGTPYDALFLALAHHRLGRREEARRWFRRGTAPAPAARFKADAIGDTSWIPRLELDILRREVAAALGPDGP